LLAGKACCRHLVVGITNPDPFLTKNESADPLRSRLSSNPLIYFERYVMIKKVLLEAGLGWPEFSIVPLPINLPERYRYYVPMDAVFLLSVYDDWGRRKLNYFESLNLSTHVLWAVPPEKKGISAGDIRSRIISGRPWEHLVPACVPPLIDAWRIAERLKHLKAMEMIHGQGKLPHSSGSV
jgi:hypothetical protein